MKTLKTIAMKLLGLSDTTESGNEATHLMDEMSARIDFLQCDFC